MWGAPPVQATVCSVAVLFVGAPAEPRAVAPDPLVAAPRKAFARLAEWIQGCRRGVDAGPAGIAKRPADRGVKVGQRRVGPCRPAGKGEWVSAAMRATGAMRPRSVPHCLIRFSKPALRSSALYIGGRRGATTRYSRLTGKQGYDIVRQAGQNCTAGVNRMGYRRCGEGVYALPPRKRGVQALAGSGLIPHRGRYERERGAWHRLAIPHRSWSFACGSRVNER